MILECANTTGRLLMLFLLWIVGDLLPSVQTRLTDITGKKVQTCKTLVKGCLSLFVVVVLTN